MGTFTRETLLAAPVEKVWAFHMLPDALLQLSPPNGYVQIIQHNPVETGARVTLAVRIPPLPVRMTWVSRYAQVTPPHLFVDVAVKSPFARWEHHHIFEDRGGHCLMRDHVEYLAPLGALGDLFGGPIIRQVLRAQFEHRHTMLARMFGRG